MKRPPLYTCRGFQFTLGLLLFPPVFWVAMLLVVPTECARRTLADRLAAATGRKVTLGKVRVGFCGGLELENLTIGTPGSTDDPWFSVADASIDVSLAQLLFGTVNPTEVTLNGLDLRILRRADGTLELADFLADPSSPTKSATASRPATVASELMIRIASGQIQIVDESAKTRLDLQSIDGLAVRKGNVMHVSDLRGTLNGGTFQLAAQIDRSGAEPAFEGQFRAKDVSLGEGMGALEYLVPVLAGTPEKLTGKLTMDLYLRGRGETSEALRESVVGHGEIQLDSVDLTGSRFIGALCALVEKPSLGHVGTVHSTLAIKAGRVISDKLTLDFGKGHPAELTGWTDFDGRLDYHPRTEGLNERLQSKGQEALSRLKIDVKDVAGVRLYGTLDRLVLTVNGTPIEDKTRLREIGQRLREKVLH
jgi:AsmA-like C-terminal region